MKKWSGGTLIASLTLLLLLRYSSLFTTFSTTTTTATTTTSTSSPTSASSAQTFWNPNPKPHLIPDLPGLSDLYSTPSSSLSYNSTLLWPHIRELISRSDALPDTATGVREGAHAWRGLMRNLEGKVRKEEVGGGDSSERLLHCPFSVSGTSRLELPCGIVQDSAVTVVGLPRGGNGSVEFWIELVGARNEGSSSPPVVLRYMVGLGGEKGDFVGQNSWTVEGGWGVKERCPALAGKSDGSTVDGLVTCSQQVIVRKVENINGSQNGNSKSVGGPSGSAPSSGSFPFIKGQPFTATLWAGLEGFHMSVNGKHESSFAYRERLEPWLVSEVKIGGDLELLSSIANGLPVSEDVSMIGDIESFKAPSVPKKRLFLLVGVFSTASNFERRMALRRTWMQYKEVRSGYAAVRFFTGLWDNYGVLIPKLQMVALRILGLTTTASNCERNWSTFEIHKSNQVNLELWKEAQTYKDIQLMPFVDYYSLISLKTVGICIFGAKVLPSKYIMKTDDDAFVRIDQVLAILKQSGSNGLLYGHITFESSPHRDKDSKWYISQEEWPSDNYPPWAHGPGYVISRDIAKFIVQGHQERNLQLFKLEDVAMGIWIQEFKKSGHEVRYSNDDRFHSSNCEDGYILAHYQGPRLILCLWEKLLKENEPVCCE